MPESTPPVVELDELLALFYDDTNQLGQFAAKTADECPAAYQDMLAHTAHMTVTVQRRHGCLVDVEVLDSRTTDTHYIRKILLCRQSDSRVVQFGIVRLALSALQPDVRDEIMAQESPLGSVLIKHDVLREVELHGLWEVVCGPEMASALQTEIGKVTYGRTALIYCDGEPAVELLEVVAAEDTF
ncbi:MAG: hypothetical protein Aurels2KO_00910 [Aureliella sp.]